MAVIDFYENFHIINSSVFEEDAGLTMQNEFIKSFNGKFRDEYLNENWFASLEEDQNKFGEW